VSYDLADTLITRETVDRVWHIISAKEALTAEIFVLRYLEELSIADIAAKTGLPVHTVKNKLYRALEQIRELLAE
jgi:DNA-directed RNA polymerase specialized sigma24 family protein